MSAMSVDLIRGAIIAYVLIFAYLARRAGKDGALGTLRFGAWVWFLALSCLVSAIVILIDIIHGDSSHNLWVSIILCLMFIIGALYCFGEAAFVRGGFDAREIEFKTLWTGTKREKWKDLVKIERNKWADWYTLSFSSGNNIHLSRFLNGHLAALKMANEQRESK